MKKCKYGKDMNLSHCNLRQCRHRLHPDKVDKNCNIIPAKRKPRTKTIHGWVDDFYLRQYALGNREEPLYVSRLKYFDIPCTHLTITYRLPTKGKG